MAVNTTEITTVFNSLISDARKVLQDELNASRINGEDYAKTLDSLLNTCIQVSVGSVQKQESADIKNDRDNIQKDIETATKQNKIDLASAQLLKAQNDATYSGEKTTQLIQSVKDNRVIKALGTLGDTYGTFGAGGLTLSANMWTTYYALVKKLTDEIEPTDTTVTKVI